jgi:hypothetical protein
MLKMIILVAGASLVAFLLACGEANPFASELRVILGYYSVLKRMEHEELIKRGRYGDLPDLLRDVPTSARFPVTARCGEGYCFEVQAVSGGYLIRIVPDLTPNAREQRAVSIYAGTNGAIHFTYGRPYANETSPVLSVEKIREWSPQE